MKLVQSFIGCVLFVAAGATQAAAETAARAPDRIVTVRLANGLKLAMAPDSLATTVDVTLWFPAASRDERAGRTGLTHLFDGLLFAGTASHPSGDQSRMIESEAGTITAFSSSDFACAGENVAPGSLEMALRLEADRMQHLSLTPETFAAARVALGRERSASAARSAAGAGLRRLYAVAFPGHPYGRPAEGLEGDLDRLALTDAQSWWNARYGPDGTWLVLSGAFNPDSAEALVRRTLGAVPRRVLPRPEAPAPAPQSAERRGSGHIASSLPLLLVGWRTPSVRDGDAPALEALERLLTHREPSRLQRQLLADSVGVISVAGGMDLRRDAGMFYVIANVSPAADTAQVERAVIEAVESIGRDAIAPAVALSAIQQTETETLFGWQTPQGLGHALGLAACFEGDVNAATAKFEAVRKLTPEALHETAARAFVPAHRTIVWMWPGAPETAAPPEPPARRTTPKGAHAKRGRS